MNDQKLLVAKIPQKCQKKTKFKLYLKISK